MSDDAPLPRLRELQDEIDGQNGVWHAVALRGSTEEAARVAMLSGSPETLESIADDYISSIRILEQAFNQLLEISDRDLPAAWIGDSQVAAEEALTAVRYAVNRGLGSLRQIADALDELALVMGSAQSSDRYGVQRLEWAHGLTEEITAGPVPDPLSYDGDLMHEAHQAAKSGIAERVDAHVRMIEKSREVSKIFTELADHALLVKLAEGKMPALDAIMFADVVHRERAGPGAY